MNKYGPHIQKPGEGLDLIERWQPRLCVLMDVDGDTIRQFRERSPDTFIIVRRHREGANWKNTGPQQWADEVWDMVGGCPPDAVYYFNEPLGHDAHQDFEEFDQKQAKYIRVMRDRGVETLAFGFATGNFTRDGPNVAECFPKSTQIAKYVHLHEYGWPSMFNTEGWPEMESWHTLRFPYWYKWFCEAGRDDLTFFITECGLTQMVLPNRPDEGWRSHADGVSNESYMRDLERYHDELCKYPWVFGATPFNWYGWWPTFEHTEEPEVVEFIVNLSGEEPQPNNNGGEEMRVFDRDGVELFGSDAENLVAYHGLSVKRPTNLQVGDRYFDVAALREKTGDTAFIFRVCNEDGSRRPNQECAWWWPNMSADDNDITEAYSTDWHDEADLGLTEENGEMGPSMGTGAYHDPNTPGPHEAWVRHPDLPSTLLDGIGMIGGTYHEHMDGEWRVTVYEAEEPDGDDPIGQIIEHAEAIISLAKGVSVDTPIEMALKYSDGDVARFELTPVSPSIMTRLMALPKKLFGR